MLKTAADGVDLDKLTAFERYNIISWSERITNDLPRSLRKDPAPYGTDPLQWWQSNHHLFSVLRHIAFDLLAAPASSAADEQQFSKAGHVLNSDQQ